MEDGVDDLLLWGDDFEVILDILEGDEAVEQQFLATEQLPSVRRSKHARSPRRLRGLSRYLELQLERLHQQPAVVPLCVGHCGRGRNRFRFKLHRAPSFGCECDLRQMLKHYFGNVTRQKTWTIQLNSTNPERGCLW